MEYLIMCIGNRDGGDDAVAPYVADLLKKEQDDFLVVNCGVAPENYTSLVTKYKPRNVIIIDAAEMGLPPGEIRIIPKEKIGTMHISTHGIPLSILINYLEQQVNHIKLIGIQPGKMTGDLSPVLKKSGNKLKTLLINKEIESLKTIN